MPYKIDSYNSPNDETTVELDPKNNGRIVSNAFLAEGFLNFFTLPLITHPRKTLSLLLLNPAHVNPATIFWARSLGTLFVTALTAALWTGVPNTRAAVESRRTVYITLGLGELGLIPILIAEVRKNGGHDAALSVKTALVAIASLAPILLWRVYVLYVKPEMIGRYREVQKKAD